jgi:RNA recognition motif-containing protein
MHTLYVGGLPAETDEGELRALFGGYGGLSDVRIVTKDAGECRGFGYVTFADDDSASQAQARLDGATHRDARLRVAFAT